MRGLVIAVPTWIPGLVPAGAGRAVTRRASLVAVLLAVALASLGAAAGLQLIPSWPASALPLPDERLLPWLVALLGMAGGALAVFAARPMPAVPLGAARAVETPAPDVAAPNVASPEPPISEWRAAMLELRGLLRDERAELATLRETCGGATHEAMTVGARLAGVALDAEARLTAGIARAVTQAEQALQRPDQAGGRLADATHFTQAAEAAARTIAATAVTAADQVAALGEVAGVLRRDAMALDAAGREIATAGAHMLARLGEAVGQADAALTRLPHMIGEAAHEAAGQVGERIAGAAEAVATQLTGLRAEMTQTRTEMATEITAAGTVLRDLAGLPDMTTELVAAAAALRADTAALGQADRQTVASTERMAARLAADLGRAEATLAALPGLIDNLDATSASLRREAGALGDAGMKISHAGHAAGREVIAATDAMAARLTAETARLQAGIEAASGAGLAAAQTLPQAAAALSAACEEGVRTLTEAAAVLCADGAALDASGRDALHATTALHHEAQFLAAAGRDAVGIGGDVVARLSATASQIAQAATEADIRAEATTAAVATLPRLAAEFAANLNAELAQTSATLRLDAGNLGEAAGRATLAAEQTQAAVAGLPGLASEIATAVGGLERETCVLTAAARQMALTGLDATARVELSAASLDASGRALGVAGDALLEQFDRVQGAMTRHDGAGQALIAAMARVEAASDEVAQAAGRMPADRQVRRDDAATAASAPLDAALRQLGGVERDAEILLRQTEALAEAVLAGDAPGLPPLLAGRAPELLTAVETTIRRLRSVATALALVSDGSRDGSTDGSTNGSTLGEIRVRGVA